MHQQRHKGSRHGTAVHQILQGSGTCEGACHSQAGHGKQLAGREQRLLLCGMSAGPELLVAMLYLCALTLHQQQMWRAAQHIS